MNSVQKRYFGICCECSTCLQLIKDATFVSRIKLLGLCYPTLQNNSSKLNPKYCIALVLILTTSFLILKENKNVKSWVRIDYGLFPDISLEYCLNSYWIFALFLADLLLVGGFFNHYSVLLQHYVICQDL